MVAFTLGVPLEGSVGFEGDRLVSRLARWGGTLRFPDAGSTGFRADIAAAAAASLSFGLEPEAVSEGLLRMEPLPHRGEVVAQANGVEFVDDSKATNPHAALASLEGRSAVVLIAGGLAKGVDLGPLSSAAPRLRGVVAIGQAAPLLERVFDGLVPTRRADSMAQAVAVAVELAHGEGTVLLAPACASQDMFVDYADRGNAFAAAAREIADGGEDG
jgi:UDP-N-acetylmuramoylalanine--D-glutamate ligase